MKEIERKWILNKLPEIGDQKTVVYSRYFLYIENGIEVRIQSKGSKYEFERKVESNDLTRTGTKFEITKEEFEHFKKISIGSIERESYKYEGISVKVYRGQLEGLIRAEVEFDSEEMANSFNPPAWFGKEITNTGLGKDKKLIRLSKEEFRKLLKTYNN